MSNEKERPSDVARAAGLNGLKDIVEATGRTEQTVISWFKKEPKLFTVAVAGTAALLRGEEFSKERRQQEQMLKAVFLSWESEKDFHTPKQTNQQ